GNPRIFNAIIDIGAYELQELPFRIPETKPVKISVFPNPADRELNVYFNVEQAENVVICLTDLAGNTLYSQNARIIKGENLYRIRTEALPAGIYLLRFQSDEEVFGAKVIVMHND
ncbi:MAG: T9SS type A sorting domain-containing protein, partial [Bacteroidales bacterium]|nr:T9SS type A sorting domain-containing protein [Bacteroidales bacterium]